MNFDSITHLFSLPPYGLEQEKKEPLLMDALRDVVAHHRDNCAPYARFYAKHPAATSAMAGLPDVPYLPTAAFKDHLLISVPQEEIARELRSSATTTGRPSRMGLDKRNNIAQMHSLQKIILNRMGNMRYEIMIMDTPAILGRSGVIPARASMAKSLLFTAASTETCLEGEEDNLRLNTDALEAFLTRPHKAPPMLFGFTFLLYAKLIRPLLEAGKSFDVPHLKIVHIGGWKKLTAEQVSEQKLVEDCIRCFSVSKENVIDIYGFTEQGGLLYPTCEYGFKHPPVWADVICRHPGTLAALPVGEEGLLQFLTPIQTSYPGHSVITEDVGRIHSYDECLCGRKGAAFTVTGRSQTATEERGCGDILAGKQRTPM